MAITGNEEYKSIVGNVGKPAWVRDLPFIPAREPGFGLLTRVKYLLEYHEPLLTPVKLEIPDLDIKPWCRRAPIWAQEQACEGKRSQFNCLLNQIECSIKHVTSRPKSWYSNSIGIATPIPRAASRLFRTRDWPKKTSAITLDPY